MGDGKAGATAGQGAVPPAHVRTRTVLEAGRDGNAQKFAPTR
jgi:hypothetical protein